MVIDMERLSLLLAVPSLSTWFWVYKKATRPSQEASRYEQCCSKVSASTPALELNLESSYLYLSPGITGMYRQILCPTLGSLSPPGPAGCVRQAGV